jgi:hypothetical protein
MQKKLLDYAHKIDTRITNGGDVTWIDADISKLHTKFLGWATTWDERLTEALGLPPEDEPTNAIVDRTFDPTAILKPLGYYYEAGCWTKDIRREPGRRDLMIEVNRRGHAGDDSANTLYDFTVYTAPEKGNTFVPFHNIFGKTPLQLKDTAERLDAWLKNTFGPLPENRTAAANVIALLLQ